MEMKIGDKWVTVDRIENGVPVIKATTETVKRPDGGTDVVVHVPCLSIAGDAKKG